MIIDIGKDWGDGETEKGIDGLLCQASLLPTSGSEHLVGKATDYHIRKGVSRHLIRRLWGSEGLELLQEFLSFPPSILASLLHVAFLLFFLLLLPLFLCLLAFLPPSFLLFSFHARVLLCFGGTISLVVLREEYEQKGEEVRRGLRGIHGSLFTRER